MKYRSMIVIVALGLAGLVGCVRHETDRELLGGDSIGYYEWPDRDRGVVYVVGSLSSYEKIKAGQTSATTRSAPMLQFAGERRFSSGGQAVLFETNGSGLANRLMAEYDRRHGLSSR
jgi:hypothetical protein